MSGPDRRSKSALAPRPQTPLPPAHPAPRNNEDSRPPHFPRAVSSPAGPDCSPPPRPPHPESSASSGNSAPAESPSRQGSPAKNSTESKHPRRATGKWIDLHRPPRKHSAARSSASAAIHTARDSYPDIRPRAGTQTGSATFREPPALPAAAAPSAAANRQSPPPCSASAASRTPRKYPPPSVCPAQRPPPAS